MITNVLNWIAGIEIYLMDFWTFGLLALRIAIGAIFLVHGKAKFKTWQSKPGVKTDGMTRVMQFLAVAETAGGLAILFGFLTQFVAIGLAIIMLGAIFFKTEKWKTGFVSQTGTGWELDLMILSGCIALMTLGGGDLSLDNYLLPLL